MKRASSAVIAFISLFLACGATQAGEVSVSIRFSTEESSIIRDYYSHYHTRPAPGKKKRAGNLPPGIAKNLARGKPLPPGIAKKVLPGELISRLPPVPGGFERVVIGGKVLLVEIATQVIHDILADIILD